MDKNHKISNMPANQFSEKEYKIFLKLRKNKSLEVSQENMIDINKISSLKVREKRNKKEELIPTTDEIKTILGNITKEYKENLKEEIKKVDYISITLSQRFLFIGFLSATKIVDYFENLGLTEIVDENGRPRRLIVDKENIIKILS